jgi:hypothetical protein
MTTWADISGAAYPATGSGAFGFRLEIEGWPAEWVTDRIITHADNADGRVILGGLQYEGIQFRERVVPHESTLQCSGMAFKIVPPYLLLNGLVETDEALYYLSQERQPVDQLAAALAHDTGTLVLRSGSTLAVDTIIHIGTEAMRLVEDNGLSRAIWGTHPQAHIVESYGKQLDVYVYTDMPPTMEGRRATLYAYGEGDDMAGDGTVVWRGLVAQLPSLNADGTSWQIDCEHRTQVLNQSIAGEIAEAHVVGIHHHVASPFVLFVSYDGDTYDPIYYVGHDLSESEFFGQINNALQFAVFTTAGASATIESVGIGRTPGGQIEIAIKRTGNAHVPFFLAAGSAILGWAGPYGDSVGWQQYVQTTTGEVEVKTLDPDDDLEPDLSYFIQFARTHPLVSTVDPGFTYDGPPATALGYAHLGLVDATRDPSKWQDDSAAAIAAYPAWRVYVDKDFTDVAQVYISGTGKPDGIFKVLDTDFDANGHYYIELEPWHGSLGTFAFGHWTGDRMAAAGFMGFLGADTTIKALREYALGALPDFVAALKTKGRDHANAGDTPFVTDADLSTFAAIAPVTPLALVRLYVFANTHALMDILKEECKFIGHFMRIEADGTIGIVPLPRWTEATPVPSTHEITADHIIPPPEGAWPGCTPNRDGRVSEVTVQHYYSWRDETHIDTPVIVQDSAAIAVSKGRGKAKHSIKPVSTPLFYTASPEMNDELARIGRNVLQFLQLRYLVVTLHLPYSKLPILCGDIVSITSDKVIGGDGTRGVTERRGVVLERQVYLDPARHMRMQLTVMLTGRNVVGYAPSAQVTGATYDGGTVATFQFDSSDTLNRALASATAGTSALVTDGKVIVHFAALDFVRIFQKDTYTVSELTGIIQSVDEAADEATIDFTDFTAGEVEDLVDAITGETVEFIMEYQADPDALLSTSSQRRYCYVATDSGLLPDGSFARRFS